MQVVIIEKIKISDKKKITRHFSFSEAISEFYFEDTEAFEQELIKTNKKYILKYKIYFINFFFIICVYHLITLEQRTL